MDLLPLAYIALPFTMTLYQGSTLNQVSPNSRGFQFYQSLKVGVLATRSSQHHFGHYYNRSFQDIPQTQYPSENQYSESPNSKVCQFHCCSLTLDQLAALQDLVTVWSLIASSEHQT